MQLTVSKRQDNFSAVRCVSSILPRMGVRGRLWHKRTSSSMVEQRPFKALVMSSSLILSTTQPGVPLGLTVKCYYAPVRKYF
jgi:hypothetical protein